MPKSRIAQHVILVSVPAAVYRESVNVSRRGITIQRSAGAVLDGEGLAGQDSIVVRAVDTQRLSSFGLTA